MRALKLNHPNAFYAPRLNEPLTDSMSMRTTSQNLNNR